MAGDIKNRIARCIESGQQLADNDDDFRIARSFEAFDDGPVVVILTAVTLHHLAPESAHDVVVRFIHFVIAFPHLRW